VDTTRSDRHWVCNFRSDGLEGPTSVLKDPQITQITQIRNHLIE
jgi:hypothetical protein